ncbi:hypothetical protein B0H11DRAFT_2054923 [Mycena galericulata]|nr:hypothetical protein B0H11DRAFT_2054923 [Mycena galericulata]
MALTLVSATFLVLAFGATVRAESHTIKFNNQCGFGTPQLIQGGNVLTTTSYTSTGELSSAIAYLQTGSCGFNGEQCTLLEMTMTNPTVVGGGSSADISLITPHTFNVATSIEFYGGCDGVGTTCGSESCATAFKQPDDTWVQVACQDDNANLLITFCPDSSSSSSDPATTSSATAKAEPTTSATTATPTNTNTRTTTSSKILTTFTTSVTHSSTPTVSTSSSSPSASMCKHKRSERRAMNAHRKRSGKSLHH